MAKPKIALIPSSQGSKLYSVLPSSGVGDFDFSRSGGATRINSQGLIETVADGVSRLNYPLIDGKVVGCPSHLLEPQSTNLIQYSEDFSNAYWTKARLTETSNSVISPYGTLNASKIFGDGSNSWKYINRNGFSLINTNYYTFSVFAKADTLNYIQLIASGATAENYQNFDLLNGVIGSGSGVFNAKIEAFVNGWYKCSMTVLATSTATTDLFINLADSATMSRAGSFLTSDGLYIFGTQLEQGSYPTSYIPSLIGSQTTRSAETATNSGDADTFNDSEGVLMAEISGFVDTDDYRMISINAGDSANTLFIGLRNDTGNAYFYLIRGQVIQANYISDVNATNTNLKLALKYKENDVSFYVNGIKLYEDTSATMISGLNQLEFNYGNANGGYPFHGNTKQIQYFDSALNDSDLEKLTSWVSFSDMANGQLYTIE